MGQRIQKILHKFIYIEAPNFNSNIEKNEDIPLNVTTPELGLVDSDPFFSSEFSEYLFFLRTKDSVSNIYYIDFPLRKLPN